MPLSHDLFQQLVTLLTPHFETLDQRRTLVGGAFFGTDVLAKIQLEGTPQEFTIRTLQSLIQHGEIESGTPAIIRLMQQLRGTVGVDKQAEIDALIDTIRYELASNPAKPTGKPRVFISYSRADGEDFATDLRKRLEAENLTLWQDRARMEGGVGWWQQITDALDAVEFMVLVATPAAIASAVVKKEWRYARQQGVCVYPVQVPGLPLDFAAMPKWMRDSHFYNLEHEWETFVNYLKAPCTVPKVPFMAPDLPEHFLPRPEKFDPLKRQLLDADFDNPVAITTALKGAGGFGKTTLAAALCDDEDIQTAFDEGVLWVTLGENPNIINKLTVLYRALTDENPGFIEIEEGANKLAEQLVDADVLLVIDDVWDPAHLRPFLRGGERVARLVTTRFANIAVDANAELLEVDEMTADESVQMLLAGIETPDDLTPFEQLEVRLGEWPLMLELTNGMLREELLEGGSIDDALAYVKQLLDEEGVTAIERDDEDERKRSAEGVLAASLRQLKPDEVTRLCELSIFVEDSNVPTTSVEALWGTQETRTRKALTRFARSSFIRFDRERSVIRMHDVVREVLHLRLTEPTKVHARLIDNYGDLTSLPDDYAWRNIAYHLTAAGRTDTLRTLLLDFVFMQAKLTATDPAALAADAALIEKGDPVMRIMRSFWQVSAHVLTKPENHDQLYNQLIGRLGLHEEQQPEVASLLETVREAAETHPDPMLILQQPSLKPAGGPLEYILQGHKGWIQGALELDDGCLLSWAADGRLRLWDASGMALQWLDGHIRQVGGARQLRDGRLLSWSWDKTLRLWESDGTFLRKLGTHRFRVNGALELDDGRLLSWADDHRLHLWDALGNHLKMLEGEGHSDVVLGALQLQDGRLLSWSADATVRLWHVNGGLQNILQCHTSIIRGVLELQDGRLLSWAIEDVLHLWDASGEHLNILEGHSDMVLGALQLQDGRLLSWSADTTLRLWDSKGNLQRMLSGHEDVIRGALELADGRLLSWSDDNTLCLWDEWDESGAYLNTTLAEHSGAVLGALQLRDRRLLSWSADNTLLLWDESGTYLNTLAEHSGAVLGALQLRDRRLLSWSADNTLCLWDSDGPNLNTRKFQAPPVDEVLELRDGRVLTWDLVTGKHLLWADTGVQLRAIDTLQEAQRLHKENREAEGELDNPIQYHEKGYNVLGYLTGDKQPILCFVTDGLPSVFTPHTSRVVVVGDGETLHFLRPNAALRRLLEQDTQAE